MLLEQNVEKVSKPAMMIMNCNGVTKNPLSPLVDAIS
jgi:hypothetical protein